MVYAPESSDLYGDNVKHDFFNFDGLELIMEGSIRKNYAGIGWTWDEDRDAFYPPKPYASWVLNETTCLWDAPVARPSVETYGSGEDAKAYDIAWDETNTRWVATDQADPVGNFRWDASASAWVAL